MIHMRYPLKHPQYRLYETGHVAYFPFADKKKKMYSIFINVKACHTLTELSHLHTNPQQSPLCSQIQPLGASLLCFQLRTCIW